VHDLWTRAGATLTGGVARVGSLVVGAVVTGGVVVDGGAATRVVGDGVGVVGVAACDAGRTSVQPGSIQFASGEGAPAGLWTTGVQPVELGPSQRVAEFALGDAPEGVTALDDVKVALSDVRCCRWRNR